MPSEAPSSAALRPTLALSSPSLARLESLGLQGFAGLGFRVLRPALNQVGR